jgi:hypothetical protein
MLLAASVAAGWSQAANTADPSQRSEARLEQLVAPIALYPDALLSQVLMAATYPLEVVEAARWSRENPKTTGQALEDAMQKQKWDASVKALTAVPQTLAMMNDKLAWTQQLGDAFLAQQADVLDAVQRLRARADAAGNLKSTPQQTVSQAKRPASAPAGGTARGSGAAPSSSATASAPEVIYTIASTDPDEYFLPIYDPGVVYGAWPYSDYEPFYWYPSGYVAGDVLSFAAGVWAGAAIWGNVDWWRHRVGINVDRYNRFNRTNIANNNWSHNPAHRHGVPYRDGNVAQRFGEDGKAAARDAFRGKAKGGQQNLLKQGAAGKGAKGAGAKGAAAQGMGGKGTAKGPGAKGKTAAKGMGVGKGKAAAKGMGGSMSKQVTRGRQGMGGGGKQMRAKSVQQRTVGQGPGAARARAQAPRNFNRGGGGLRAGGGGMMRGGFRGGGRRR